MEGCGDFVQCLLPDMSIKILSCLDNPSDLIRVSAVSSSWRQFGNYSIYALHFTTVSLAYLC